MEEGKYLLKDQGDVIVKYGGHVWNERWGKKLPHQLNGTTNMTPKKKKRKKNKKTTTPK